jgi:hypothetical protein
LGDRRQGLGPGFYFTKQQMFLSEADVPCRP